MTVPREIKPIPVSKKCRVCKGDKLLSEFEFANKSMSKRTTICKSCVEKLEEEDTCCECHFDDAVFDYTMSSLIHTLDMITTLQNNGFEIPEELLNRMHEIIEKEESDR